MADRYRVVVTPGAEADIIDLPTASLKKEALRLILSLRDDPHHGEELRARPNIQVLSDCRKIRFDDPDRSSRIKKVGPRYRIVYRNEPEGAPQQISILAVARREDLDAYRRAAAETPVSIGDSARQNPKSAYFVRKSSDTGGVK